MEEDYSKGGHQLRWISKKYLFGYFFFAIFLFLLYQFLRVLTPFLNTILIAVVLAMVFFPLNRRVRALLPGYPNIGSGLSVLAVMLVLVIPLVFFGWMLLRESRVLLEIGEHLADSIPQAGAVFAPPAGSLWDNMQALGTKLNIDFQAMIFSNIRAMGEGLAVSGAHALRNALVLVMEFFVLLLALFLFFRDGERIVAKLMELAPMDMRHKRLIARRLYVTIVAVVRGLLLTAAIQGSTAAVGYAIGGVRVPITLGFLTALATLIPFGGSALVWVPTGLYVFFENSHPLGIFVLAWGALVVVWIDNIFRPLLIGAEAELPVVLLFLALIGGLRAYGPSGLLLGPLLLACILVFIKIYQDEFSGKPDDAPARADKPDAQR
ncbi:MAG: AI-2E family transporter [Elusimicrobiales bacterium]|nr:AI-2E family transporter [Elusimicrobiales bacterium]